MKFKYHHTDEGFCRVCFTTQGKINTKNTYYYCIQEDNAHPVMYRCSNYHDAPWEPGYSVSIEGKIKFDLPDSLDEYSRNLIDTWQQYNNGK